MKAKTTEIKGGESTPPPGIARCHWCESHYPESAIVDGVCPDCRKWGAVLLPSAREIVLAGPVTIRVLGDLTVVGITMDGGRP
ncbi:hypothetical protein SAMN02949497_3447 [Methylomagnum ishizawai]|uniref:Uncharacterized protein n=1 Tax=Methylomagnum ishizawai TaxID=1760988 RepID=A0A1Y6D0G6_9GAMM|nr:hypothetical protein [Methylomagnum ishizawai]SMF96066.1 hypothetical protein SAMN02949497_3447 [Methylomagnum ishizawai]